MSNIEQYGKFEIVGLLVSKRTSEYDGKTYLNAIIKYQPYNNISVIFTTQELFDSVKEKSIVKVSGEVGSKNLSKHYFNVNKVEVLQQLNNKTTKTSDDDLFINHDVDTSDFNDIMDDILME